MYVCDTERDIHVETSNKTDLRPRFILGNSA